MNDTENGTAPAPTEADPQTVTTSETDSSIADEGDPGFLRRVAQGKVRPEPVNDGLEHRDHAAYMREIDRRIRELGGRANNPFSLPGMVGMVMRMIGRRS